MRATILRPVQGSLAAEARCEKSKGRCKLGENREEYPKSTILEDGEFVIARQFIGFPKRKRVLVEGINFPIIRIRDIRYALLGLLKCRAKAHCLPL